MNKKLRNIAISAAFTGLALAPSCDNNKKIEIYELTKKDSVLIQMPDKTYKERLKILEEICVQEGCSYEDMKKHTKLFCGQARIHNDDINVALVKHDRNPIFYSESERRKINEKKEYLKRVQETKAEEENTRQ